MLAPSLPMLLGALAVALLGLVLGLRLKGGLRIAVITIAALPFLAGCASWMLASAGWRPGLEMGGGAAASEGFQQGLIEGANSYAYTLADGSADYLTTTRVQRIANADTGARFDCAEISAESAKLRGFLARAEAGQISAPALDVPQAPAWFDCFEADKIAGDTAGGQALRAWNAPRTAESDPQATLATFYAIYPGGPAFSWRRAVDCTDAAMGCESVASQ